MADQCPSSSHISGPPESPWNKAQPNWNVCSCDSYIPPQFTIQHQQSLDITDAVDPSPGEHLPDSCQLLLQSIQHTTCWRWCCTAATNAGTDPEAAGEPRPLGECQGDFLGDRQTFYFTSTSRCLCRWEFVSALPSASRPHPAIKHFFPTV